jgi:hypothetical protein
MPLKLNSSGGGSVTLDVPSTASTFTATIPANTGTVVTTGSTAAVTPAMLSTGAPAWDGSGNLSFNSGYGSVATAYGCRAWVNFNGTGTVAIRGSGNVSSITDGGTGAYTVNFTTAMSDANYSTIATTRSNFGVDGGLIFFDGNFSAGNTGPINTISRGTGASYDPTIVCVAVFR